MKAIIGEKYGSPDVLELREMEKPIPAQDEVLVRVYASSVNPVDWYGMKGLYIARLMSGLLKPKDPRVGTDFAGVVEAVGASVKDFRVGDEVYGGAGATFAEFACVKNGIAAKPANLSFEQAAAVPCAGVSALQAVRDQAQIRPGDKVLINGASGGVGTFAVQIAKAMGAEVTGVCSTGNVELVRSLGADHVVDYTKDDFTLGEQRYDVFLDIAGSRSWAACRRVLKPDARFVIVGGRKSNMVIGPLGHVIGLSIASLRASQKVTFFIAHQNRDDLNVLREMIEAGKITPAIDRQYTLSEVPQAMRYLGEGHAKAKVVISIK